MDLAEYQRLLRAHWRAEVARAKGDPHLRPDRKEHAKAWRVLEKPRGREMIAALPSAREVCAAVRLHLERTLGLAGLGISVGRVNLSGAFRTLDSKFQPVGMNADDRKERYWFFSSFEVPFTARTAEGLFRDRVLVDEDDDGRWRCRSDRFTKDSIRQRVVRPLRRVVVVTVANRAAADAVARIVRPKAIDVEVWPQAQWDRMEGDRLLGALHGPVRFKKVGKRLARKLAREFEHATTAIPMRRSERARCGGHAA